VSIDEVREMLSITTKMRMNLAICQYVMARINIILTQSKTERERKLLTCMIFTKNLIILWVDTKVRTKMMMHGIV
jgi:hypothetical protein